MRRVLPLACVMFIKPCAFALVQNIYLYFTLRYQFAISYRRASSLLRARIYMQYVVPVIFCTKGIF